MGSLKLPSFTQKEVNYFLEACNFSEIEERVFLMRSKDIPLDKVAENIDVSYKTAYRINKRVKDKIIKAI